MMLPAHAPDIPRSRENILILSMRVSTSGPVLGLILVSILYAGCASSAEIIEASPDLPAEFPHHSIQDISFAIDADTDAIQSYSARAQLSINSPSQRGTYSATLLNRRADSLLITVGQFGFDGLRALVTPDSFYVYDVLRNRVTYGSVDEAAASFPIPVGGDDVFRSLIGTLVPAHDSDWILNAGGRYYTLSNARLGRTLVIDPTIWRVIRYEERDAAGDLVEERLYSDFQDFDGKYLPRRVTINVPPHESSITLVYRSISLNPASIDFTLEVNRSADYIPAGN